MLHGRSKHVAWFLTIAFAAHSAAESQHLTQTVKALSLRLTSVISEVMSEVKDVKKTTKEVLNSTKLFALYLRRKCYAYVSNGGRHAIGAQHVHANLPDRSKRT